MTIRGLIKRASYAFGRRNRAAKLRFALNFAEANGVRSVLVVGVYPEANADANQVEHGLRRRYPDLVATGLLVGHGRWRYYVVADARQLPFANNSFDLVYSNAVIEHVGSEDDQQRFIDEHARVGRTWIATTPNRFFPIEPHFHGLFTHWARSWNVEGIRLLSRGEFRDLLPPGSHLVGSPLHPTFAAYAGTPPR